MLRAVFYAVICLIAAATLPQGKVLANSSTQSLEELDARLPGKLVNDPSRLDWESYGADLVRTPVVDEEIPGGGAAIRFEIKRADEFIYAAGTNVPLIKSVGRGDDITIGFYARTVEAQTDDGKGILRVRFQQNAAPYPGFGEKTLSIGKEWDWYEVTAEAEQKLRVKDGIVALQFGRTRQIIEIGQTIVVSGAKAIAGDVARPVLAAPVVEPVLPETLQNTGTLLNSPSERDWSMGGNAGEWSERDEQQIWLGKATRFSTNEGGEDPGTLYAHIPIAQEIAEGDELLLAIAARAESASTGDGRAVVGVMVDDKDPPHESFARNRFTLGPKWQLIRIKTMSPHAYAAGNARLTLLFGWAQQEVDIGPVYVLKTN